MTDNIPFVCSHCGAAWDYTHEHGQCPVMAATDRILANRDIQPPEGGLTINGDFVGRYDAKGRLVSGHLYADKKGNVKWIADGDIK